MPYSIPLAEVYICQIVSLGFGNLSLVNVVDVSTDFGSEEPGSWFERRNITSELLVTSLAPVAFTLSIKTGHYVCELNT